MDIKEFVELGFLQEINRRVLHPAGLALAIKIDDEGKYSLHSVQDCRQDPEGIFWKFVSGLERALAKVESVNRQIAAKIPARMALDIGCGPDGIQILPGMPVPGKSYIDFK